MGKGKVAIALAAETGAALRTVYKWLDGGEVSELTQWALEKAAVLLDMADDVDRIRAKQTAQGAA